MSFRNRLTRLENLKGPTNCVIAQHPLGSDYSSIPRCTTSMIWQEWFCGENPKVKSLHIANHETEKSE